MQPISRIFPIVSLLLYADDAMVFLEATPANAIFIKGILDELSKVTSLHVNQLKSTTYFSTAVPNKDEFLHTLGMSE